MKFRIFTLLLAALLLLGGSVFACGDDDDPSTGSGQAEDADDDADDDTTSPDDDDTGDDDTETAFNSAVLAGKTYYCDIPLGAWSKPIGSATSSDTMFRFCFSACKASRKARWI